MERRTDTDDGVLALSIHATHDAFYSWKEHRKDSRQNAEHRFEGTALQSLQGVSDLPEFEPFNPNNVYHYRLFFARTVR